MVIRIGKNEAVNLNNISSELTKVDCGLGWDIRKTPGIPYDLDFFMLMLNANGDLINDDSMVFYNNPKDPSGAVVTEKDNVTGDAEGYDERGSVDLVKVPKEVQSVIFCVSVFEFDKRKQNFGQINKAHCEVLNGDTKQKLVRYDLTEDMSTGTGVIVCQLEREGGSWKFIALGNVVKGGMPELLRRYGIAYQG
jgi:tellurium resistance protein TerD